MALAATCFVDDFAYTAVEGEGCPVEKGVAAANPALSEILGQKQYCLNDDKTVIIPGFRGSGAVARTQFLVKGKKGPNESVARSARYFGGRTACEDPTSEEVSLRVAAAKRAWRVGGKIWVQLLPDRVHPATRTRE